MLVGRDRELDRLRDALAATGAGHGRVVVLVGAAGIGKSRLTEAAAALAVDRGFAVARSHAVDDPGAPPLWPWTRLIRGRPGCDRLPAFDGDGSDAVARFARFVAVTDIVVAWASERPLLVVLEDLHWADTTSLELLRHVAAELVGVPLCLLVTSRDTPLPVVLADLAGRDPAETLLVAGLTAADVARWWPALTGRDDAARASAVHGRTGGNPLLVRLLAQQEAEAHDPSPDGTAHPVLRRFAAVRTAALDPATREVVEVAAVLGERPPVEVVREIVGRTVDREIAAAVAAGVLKRHEAGIAFEHALVRDAVHGDLTPERRAALHRAVAVALGRRRGTPAGPVAGHWERADGPDAGEQCVVWAQRADDEARATFAHDDALRWAALAADRARAVGAGPADLAAVLVRLAEAQCAVGRVDTSLETCREAAALATGASRPDLVAAAGLVIHGFGNPDLNRAVAAICESALAALPREDRALRARLLAQIAVGAAETEGGDRPAELAAVALAEADASGDAGAQLDALSARHLAISVPETVVERLELGRRSVAIAATQSRAAPALWGHLWRADAALQLGNLPEVEHELAEVDRVATTRGSVLARWHHHRFQALLTLLLGDFAAARGHDRAALDLAGQIGEMSLRGMSYSFRSHLAVLRGDSGELPADWYDVIRAGPPMPLVRAAVPMQLAVAGRFDDARAAFEPFRHVAAEYPVGVRWTGTLALLGRVAILLDDVEVAAVVHDRLRPTGRWYSGDGSGAVFSHGANAGLLGELALVAGRPELAVAHQRDAVAMNRRIGARPHLALSRLCWARALVAVGDDPAAAAELAREAAAEFRRLDMPGPLRTAEQVVAPVPTASPPSPLSTREREVADLVGAALSNRQIADRLVLSERTVETHVRNILAKLGFTGRTEIATWIVARRFVSPGDERRSAGR